MCNSHPLGLRGVFWNLAEIDVGVGGGHSNLLISASIG